MRPPEHWHLRRQRRQPRVWLAIAGIVLLTLVAVLFLRLRPSDAQSAVPERLVSSSADSCIAGLDCVPESGSGLYVEVDEPPPQVSARAAAVVEDACGALLYGRNAHQRLAPASLTKIATALVAARNADLSQEVEVRVNGALLVASTDSSVMGLEPGMHLPLRDLLYGLLLPSGNDAAIAIAEEVGGTVQGFVEMMNGEAVRLGLRDTRFANPHGLDEPGLFTSAHDIAMLGREALAEPELAEIMRTKTYQPAWPGPQIWNGNELLGYYPGTVGVKIGFTERAGQTMVAAVERDGRRLIVSVLGSFQRYTDVIDLFDWAFEHTSPGCESEARIP
jgi:D-alanyl-D-alanine carboxypeptidase